MPEALRKAFVCGHPIAHSRSPSIHRYWLERYGIEGAYEAIDIAPAEFAAFFFGLPRSDFVGGNVTIPHKEEAFMLSKAAETVAQEIGAVNTLWLDNGLVRSTNTDSYGFAANLDERIPGWDRAGNAAIIGAGGAARAIVHALKQRGIDNIRILNRTIGRAVSMAGQFGAGVSAHGLDEAPAILADTQLLVNTTSLGMDGTLSLPADPAHLPPGSLVTDIVYAPLETPFLERARKTGHRTVDGLGMLLHQAVPGFALWFGRRPEVTGELREMIEAGLGRPS